MCSVAFFKHQDLCVSVCWEKALSYPSSFSSSYEVMDSPISYNTALVIACCIVVISVYNKVQTISIVLIVAFLKLSNISLVVIQH